VAPEPVGKSSSHGLYHRLIPAGPPIVMQVDPKGLP